jgi:hypothetical protein
LSETEALYQKDKDQCLNVKDSRFKPADANKSHVDALNQIIVFHTVN